MGASIFPISNYGGSQYDINILVWKVKYKSPSHAHHILTNGAGESIALPTCFLFVLKAYVKAATTVALAFCGQVGTLTVVHTHVLDSCLLTHNRYYFTLYSPCFHASPVIKSYHPYNQNFEICLFF